MITELARFFGVGIAAMLTHLLVVMALVPLGITPLAANGIGFLVAFQVSYIGHSRWTFRSTGGVRQYFRFFSVAAPAFVLNETVYALVLRFSSLNYLPALALILTSIAVLTYLSSRMWAFRNRHGDI